MNMYLFELKSNRRFAITWIIAIFLIVLMQLSFYPILSSDMDNFIKIMDNLPDALKTALGVNTKLLGSILGYYSFLLIFVFIVVAIEGMILGLSILSKEIREKTADFLLSKPVTRIQIVTSKIMSSLTLIFITNVIFLIGFYFVLSIFSNTSISISTYILLTLPLLFVQIIFFTLGLLISVLIPKVKAILSISLGTVFGFYLLSTFTDDKLRMIMPFKYFNMTEILIKNSYEIKYVSLSLLIVILFISLTYIVYKKKDIDAV